MLLKGVTIVLLPQKEGYAVLQILFIEKGDKKKTWTL